MPDSVFIKFSSKNADILENSELGKDKGIIIVIVGIIGMIIQGKFKKVVEFIIEYF